MGYILGIDPSLRGTGLAVVEFNPPHVPRLVHSETVHIGAKSSAAHCLGSIFQCISKVMAKWPIKHAALEQTIYVQNFKTAQIMGSARGAAIAAVAVNAIEVYEYAPLRIKQAVLGFGRASKEQIAKIIRQHLNLTTLLPYDESDAAAVALCHAFTWREVE